MALDPRTWGRTEAEGVAARFDALAGEPACSLACTRACECGPTSRGCPSRTAARRLSRSGDGALFAREIARIMSPGAAVVWSNALGEAAPCFLPPATLVAAMHRATGDPWTAVCAEAHWGT